MTAEGLFFCTFEFKNIICLSFKHSNETLLSICVINKMTESFCEIKVKYRHPLSINQYSKEMFFYFYMILVSI